MNAHEDIMDMVIYATRDMATYNPSGESGNIYIGNNIRVSYNGTFWISTEHCNLYINETEFYIWSEMIFENYHELTEEEFFQQSLIHDLYDITYSDIKLLSKHYTRIKYDFIHKQQLYDSELRKQRKLDVDMFEQHLKMNQRVNEHYYNALFNTILNGENNNEH